MSCYKKSSSENIFIPIDPYLIIQADWLAREAMIKRLRKKEENKSAKDELSQKNIER